MFAEPSPRELLTALNALRLDAQNVYTITSKERVELRQPDVVITFEEGRLVFFEPFEGQVTGFAFSGVGHVLALPRDAGEKQQMARFLGAPVLDQLFVSAYVRFTDDTAATLHAELARAGVRADADPGFVSLWHSQLARLNQSHSLRILIERYSRAPRRFFHAGIDGVVTGPFDILADQWRMENMLIGQPRKLGQASFYDAWSSYAVAGFQPPKLPFHAERYAVDTTIHADNSLGGTATVEFRALAGSEQFLFIELARALKIDSIALDSGGPIPFFQNEGLTEQELRTRGDDSLCVFLPKAYAAGETFRLNFKYHGNVISNAGNGVLFVGARESWYPHYGDTAEFSLYDLRFHWPKHLRLVATGEKSDEKEEGNSRSARWQTEIPVTQAGFNLGEYAVASLASGNHTVDLYANKMLEEAVMALLTKPTPQLEPGLHRPSIIPNVNVMGPPTPSPADALKHLAREVDTSIHFYERYSGPFPFRHLSVSQIPGEFGQGWPGLVYLSTFSFLPQEAQARAGLDIKNQEMFREIVPFHEVAHQWWGNVVGWSSYRDQWIEESVAAYLAILFADSQKNPDRTLRAWLERGRQRLISKSATEDLSPAEVGPLSMGTRLASSKSPEAYEALIYSKGPWVIHMLREMLKQPNTAEPDARFTALLRGIIAKYSRAAFTTADFQKEVEAVMTPKMALEGGKSMEWFFDEFVRGAGIPHYKVQFSSRKTEKGFQVKGKLLQSGVPRAFIASVPLYATAGVGRSVYLGTVLATGEETPFAFSAAIAPRKLIIDPKMTLLCAPE